MRSTLRLAVAALGFLTLSSSSSAAELTGSPITDGWTASGTTSLDNGTYVRGSGNFAYDLYSTSYALDPTSSLIASTASDTGFEWLAGDTILGIGGVIKAPETAGDYGWGGLTGSAINSEISLSIRAVAKFGTSPLSWGASSTAPSPGNGLGSSSSGHGGNGAILLGNPNPPPQLHTLAAEGAYYIPGVATQYRTSTDTNINGKVGRMVWDLNDSTLFLEKWETILNVSLLQRNALAYGYVGFEAPQAGDRGIATLQRSNSSTLFTDATFVTVPEPASLAVVGFATIVLARRGRSGRSGK